MTTDSDKERVRCRPAGPQARRPAGRLASKVRRLVPLLLKWFTKQARDLPWRRTFDPYAVWVSEIMLQQTQVKTVIPYWKRWMAALPTARALAEAPPERVLKLWEGLGYYTRARNLQKAARLIVEHHAGKFPETFEEVLALPGIGRYTAGAICSIARDQPRPILDGNVIRVLTRLFGIEENPRDKATNAHLWQLAEALVRAAARTESPVARRCSFLNQSLMELGALVCTPRQPQCDECPVQSLCVAKRTNRVEALPNLAKRATATARRFLAFVIEREGHWLVSQRPAGGVNAHLWEFPNCEVPLDTADVAAVAKTLFGLTAVKLKPLGTVKHSITRYRISLEAYRAETGKVKLGEGTNSRWLPLAELEALAFTSAHRRVLKMLCG